MTSPPPADQPVIQPVAAPVQPVVAPVVQPVGPPPVVALAVYHPTEAVVEVTQEPSLGEVAKRNKQRRACVKLAADNPSITCQ
jgi:hypothetical protein